ncbi:MAG: PAS domain-containing protein [Intestinibacter sp.]
MEQLNFIKSMANADPSPIIICDLNHVIVYMNPAACKRYQNSGGKNLLRNSIMNCHNPKSEERINNILTWFQKSKNNNRVYIERNTKENIDVYMIALRNDDEELIGYYEKMEYRNIETIPLFDMN